MSIQSLASLWGWRPLRACLGNEGSAGVDKMLLYSLDLLYIHGKCLLFMENLDSC